MVGRKVRKQEDVFQCHGYTLASVRGPQFKQEKAVCSTYYSTIIRPFGKWLFAVLVGLRVTVWSLSNFLRDPWDYAGIGLQWLLLGAPMSSFAINSIAVRHGVSTD